MILPAKTAGSEFGRKTANQNRQQPINDYCMKRTTLLLLVLTAVLASCSTAQKVEIVPKPVSLVQSSGTVAFDRTVTFKSDDAGLLSLVATWHEIYAPVAGAELADAGGKADVTLVLDPSLEKEEYSLEAARHAGITVRGGSEAGVWWGLQTLAQILSQCASEDGFEVPCLRISDKPQFSYRGGMLDCGRHFFPVEDVKKFIDILAVHKLNIFHWHLTDDQGWRIEIRKYPLLTQVGAFRADIGDTFRTPENKGIPYGGYYSQDEIREIVRYAADRQITVIPEIELPGHSMSAIASYPQLGCRGRGYTVPTSWGPKEDIFCAGKDFTIRFLEDVMDEVCELFPSEYIHIGGDEAPTIRWENCPNCRRKMKELGLDNVAYLHGYLLKTVEGYLNGKGRKIIGWDEILDAGVTPTATVMSWRGAAGGKRAALQGNDVIMAPNSYFYLNYYQTSDPEANGEPLGHHHFLPLTRVYSFDPYEELDEDAKSHIVGIQGNLWTEFICELDHAEQMYLPRCGALSEDAWGSEKEDFDSFRQRLIDVMLPLYDALGLNYATYGLYEEVTVTGPDLLW